MKKKQTAKQTKQQAAIDKAARIQNINDQLDYIENQIIALNEEAADLERQLHQLERQK